MMSEPAVKLIGFFGSPVVHRAEVALRLKGVPYELIEEDLGNKSDLLLKSNPVHKKVPVLLHGEWPGICESLVILEYVDEAFDGPRLVPSDPLARAAVRFWASFVDKQCMEAMWKALWMGGEAQAASMREANSNLTLIETQLPEGKRFFGGDAIGFLDIDVSGIGIAHWMGLYEEIAGVRLMTEEEHPALYRWAREYMADETVRQCLPEYRDRLLAALAPMRDRFVSIARAMAAEK